MLDSCETWLLVPKFVAQESRRRLNNAGIFDGTRKVRISGNEARVPVGVCDQHCLEELVRDLNMKLDNNSTARAQIQVLNCQPDKTDDSRPQSKLLQLQGRVKQLLHLNQQGAIDMNDPLLSSLPSSYELYGDLILLPSAALRLIEHHQMPSVLNTICDIFNVKRVARKNAVIDDAFRRPRTDLLLGTDGWVVKTENKINYHFDIRKCMFSRGNISEKLRIAQFECERETVVDLFAGIGYFVLPYLVHAKAQHVYACEWNPDSVQALEKNLRAARVENRCTVLSGDNREVCPVDVADRVNLGLIPSSRMSWKTAVKALKSTGGILHIHANVEVKAGEEKQETFQQFAETTSGEIRNLLNDEKPGRDWRTRVEHIECIKSYGPRIYHIVVDLRCEPS